MKRILLVLGILLFSFNSNLFAQLKGQYTLKYSVRIEHHEHQRVCGSEYKIAALFEKNTPEFKLADSPYRKNSFTDVSKFNEFYHFDNDNKIKKFTINTFINDQYNTWAPCRGGVGTNFEIILNNQTDYPSYYINRSSFMKKDNNRNEITSYLSFNIYAKPYLSFIEGEDDRNKKIICKTKSVKIFASKNYHNESKVYKWEFLDPVNTTTTYTTVYQSLLDAAENAFNQYIACTNSSGNGDATELRTEQKELYVNTKEGLNYQQKIAPIDGNCDYYYDRYLLARDNLNNYKGDKTRPVFHWRPITGIDFEGKEMIDLTLAHLYSNESDRDKALNNKTISIRLNPEGSDNLDISNVIKIQFLPEPPEIAREPDFKPLKCAESAIGGFKFYFKRQLYSGEKLYISLKRKLDKLPYTYEPHDNNLDITRLKAETGGVYSYTWVDKTNSLIEGKYEAVISGFDTDDNTFDSSPFCKEYIFPFEIKTPEPLTYIAEVVQQETCFGAKNGKILITASGGHEFVFSNPALPRAPKVPIGPGDPLDPIDPVDPGPTDPAPTTVKNTYEYSLDNGVTWSTDSFEDSITVENLPSGTYKIKVRDKNGCTSKPENIPLTIKKISKIIHDILIIEHPSASGKNDASIKINSISGGTPKGTGNKYYNYKILKNGIASDIIKTGNTILRLITGLPAGKHIIEYTDANGCTQDYELPPLIDPEPIDFTPSTTKPDCNGGANGIITISNIKGGYPPYEVTITQTTGGSYAEIFSNVAQNTVINTINENILAGKYKVTVKDARLVKKSVDVTVDVRSKIEITDINATPILCNGNKSTITITATGGKTGSYQYAIYKTTGMVWQNENTFLLPASPNIGYRFKVREEINGTLFCESTISTYKRISEPNPIEIIKRTVVHNDIFGESKGEITLEIDGGTPNYKVSWVKKGDGAFSGIGNPIKDLTAGTYIATITDANNCSVTFNASDDEIIVKQNPELKVLSIDIIKEIRCNGGKGTLKVTAGGGTESYTYKWFRDNVELAGETAEELIDVKAGNYSVKVFDGFKTVTDFKKLEDKLKLELQVSKTDITCFGVEDGTIKIMPTGGSGDYFYSIDDKTSYQLISSLTNSTITGLVKGNYNVWLKDANNCEIDAPIKVIIKEPKQIKINSFSVTNCSTIGGDEGNISIETSGGKGTLLYTWSKDGSAAFSKTTKSITGLYVGVYTVLIKDDNNCELVKSFEVKEPKPIQVSIKKTTEISCFNGDNGSLLAEVTGGYPIESTSSDFNYKWYIIENGIETLLNTDVTLNKISSLKRGKYKVVVNDSKGETTSTEVLLNEPSKIEINLVSKQNVNCFEGADGKIDISVIGGVSAYTYSWTKEGDTTFTKYSEDIDGLTVGKYKVEVEDSNKCKIISSFFDIKEPNEALDITSFEVVNLTGFETGDGSISITPKGGTPSYTYEWRAIGTTDIIGTENKKENLQIGTYEVTISDSKGCEVIETYSITQPDLLEITSINQSTEILCFGDKGINLSSEVTGGVVPYTYSWSLKGSITELSNTSTLNNAGAGDYVLKIIDANLIKTSKEYNLAEPLLLEISSIKVEDVSCHGESTGRIEVEAKGGVAPYVYSWSHGVTGNILTNLSSGTYTLTIRDKNLCEVVKEVIISEPLSSLSVKKEVTIDVTGNGLSNGSIAVEIEGGTPSYSYQWKDSNNVILSNTTNTLSGIKVGDYTLTVVDSKKCELTLNYTIKEPLPLLVDVKETAVLCNGGEGKLTTKVTGGVEPYTYAWYNSGGTIISTAPNLTQVSGVYSLEILDSKNNLTRVDNINITEPLLLEVSSIDINAVTCYQGNDGNITINVIGGVAPYSYNWTHSSIDSNEVTTLKAGLYSVKITDKNGCSILKENIKIIEPEVYKIKETRLVRPSNSTANNGSIEVTIIGGSGPYLYVWEDKNSQEVSNTTSNSKSDKIENLLEGQYKITITDSKGCVIQETYNLADPGELLVSIIQVQEISCFGGNNGIIDVVTVGGAGGNNYKWYNATTGVIMGTNKQLENIPAGKYYVVVNNAEGIEEQSSILIVKEPTEIKVTETIKDLSCFESNNGTLSLNIVGGTDTYEYRYRLQGNSYSDWIEVKNNSTTIKYLQAGTYEVQLKDGNNCFATNTNGADEYTYVIKQPDSLNIITKEVKEPTGFGLSNGSISISIKGGTSPYNYIWKKGTNIISDTTTNSLVGSIGSLTSGNYSVVITDSKGCTLEKSYVLEEPLKLEASIVLTSVISCKGEDNGKLQANVKGGVLGYTYNWFKEGSTSVLGKEKSLSGLGESKYYVEIEDSKGNKVRSSSYELIEPETLTLELSSDYILCGTGNDWTVASTVTGGTAPYSYLWNTGSSTANLENVETGSYELTVVDINGCRNTVNIKLTLPKVLNIITKEIEEPTGFGLPNGSIAVSIEGGIPPYNYVWKKGTNIISDTTINSLIGNIGSLTSGNYSVVITDSKGCTLEKTYILEEPLKLEVTIELISVISCQGENDGKLQAKVSGGVLGYTYKWFKEGNTSVLGTEKKLSNLGESKYYVEIEDSKGNIARSSLYELIEPERLTVELNSDYTLCGTRNDWTITSTVKGGTSPYSYLWNTGSNSANLENVQLGSYELIVVDANGCRSTIDITPNTPIPLSVNDFKITNPTCYEGNDGKIELNIVGGVSPYKVDWNNQLTGNTIENLVAGVYEVLVTDAKGCTYRGSYEIENPEKIEFDLGEEVTLCKDQTYIIDASIDTGVEYMWSSNNGFSNSSSIIEVSKAGIYNVVIKTKLGCIVSDSIEIKKSDAEINSEFTMSSQVYTNESFVIVNLSDPKPDEVVWFFPSNAKIIEKNDNYAEIIIEEEGEYEITILSKIGNCEEFLTKKVLVLEKEIEDDSNEQDINRSILSSVVLYPNPSSGKFNLDIELNKENPISLKFYRLNSTMIKDEEHKGKDIYKLAYDFNLVSGVYFLLIETKKERIIKKIIIK